eukprot:TRINITY_DN4827_c0_g2_i2.p1 TRINITY_DN4827_c0_g2~~TRINITY_DN4827_c0_g2_i2.p1  ORF type:complete len:313 (-),score=46.97 TRINITY_DN4827_c0_g2_i2:52-990(-)
MDAKEEFTKLLQSHIESLRPINQKIYCLTQEMYDKALEAVQLKKGVKCPEGARFKFWVLKHFKIHERGSKKVLYCRKSSLPVVPKDKIYYAIERCHIRVGHSGRDKTWEEIKTNYAWIRYDIIHLYLRTCRVCSNKVPLKKQPLILMEFMTRVQMDLIDMTSRPDKSYKWILHMQDTFSQFSWTHPLPSKHHPETLANKLLETFCMFGSPQILQIYNGKEFLDGLIKQLAEKWSGIQILDGGTSPQGCCIKGANDDMELKLGKWLEGNPGRGWAQGLQFVTYSMNTFKSSTTNTSPYEVVFGQLPHGKYLER